MTNRKSEHPKVGYLVTYRGELVTVDWGDYLVLRNFKWRSHERGYIRTSIRIDHEDGSYGYQVLSVHRLVMGARPGQLVDHIDGNPFNNCRSNLRIATSAQNVWNSRCRKNSKSKYKGLTWVAKRKNWRVRIRANGELIELGCFRDRDAAVKAYNEAAKKYHGEFAWLNKEGQHEKS